MGFQKRELLCSKPFLIQIIHYNCYNSWALRINHFAKSHSKDTLFLLRVYGSVFQPGSAEPLGAVECSRGAANFWNWGLFTGKKLQLRVQPNCSITKEGCRESKQVEKHWLIVSPWRCLFSGFPHWGWLRKRSHPRYSHEASRLRRDLALLSQHLCQTFARKSIPRIC